jgi:ADP-ribose pyrophosphatase YjhB (NUDIX family)
VTARFCLLCGARLRVAVVEDHRRRRCPRCGWIHYANPVPAATAVIVDRRRLLLGRRARPPYAGAWDLPGGFLEPNEGPLEGLRRELREELGVGVRRATLIGFANDRYGRTGFAVLSVIYRVQLSSHRVRPADDVSALDWFRLADIPYREIAFPGIRRLLRQYLSSTR